MRNNIGKYAATIAWPVLVTALILVAWELSVRALGIRSIILPPPSVVFETMAQRHDLLFAHLWPSLYLTVLGFVLSVIGGIVVAVLITYSAIVRKGFYPAFLVAFFPMTINAAMGFESIDEDIHRMARTFMGSRWQIFWKIRMPNALPYIFGGMKISITLAIIGVIVSEFVASQEGIGYLIKLAVGLLDTPL